MADAGHADGCASGRGRGALPEQDKQIAELAVDVAEDLARKLNLSRFDRSNVRLATPALPPKAVAREAWANLAERRLCLEHSDRVLGKKLELVDNMPARSTPSYARVGTHRRSAVGVQYSIEVSTRCKTS